ncbi:LutC/YkgG family protein [Streptomyces fuscichromogenes]|uniref:Lactate utilization protein C n=1 Tax=Streptomyces fuscichromogenes TaxID=1324013 RepID=A0A918CWE5_9ACTN|nr:LUD domain-containing protein [Streptomyces fuscichromogenes]GGN39420.1 lactate utilization protein C [Streptomyces fuscichromogenes]
MSTGAREEILGRIRSATADLPTQSPEVPRTYLRHAPDVDPADRETVLALFAERLEEYGATVYRAGPAGLVSTLAEVLPAGRVMVPTGFPIAWLTQWAGEALTEETTPLSRRQLDGLDAVLTTCAVAIAESGTVVLDTGPGQGRRAATLLPDLHVCVVRAGQVFSSMPEVIGSLDPLRPLTWISGPSATADIEMIRVPGVHGPRRLTVVLLLEEDQSRDAVG